MTLLPRTASLGTAFYGLLLVIFLPSLAVIGASLYHAGNSFRDLSESRLMEISRVVARAATSEIRTIERIVEAIADDDDLLQDSVNQNLVAALGEGGSYRIIRLDSDIGDDALRAEGILDPIIPVARLAINTGAWQISNLIRSTDAATSEPVVAIVGVVTNRSGDRLLVVALNHPLRLLQSLTLQRNDMGPVIVAITDGAGFIVGRSVDEATFLGRPVPDWAALKALNSPSGTFSAKTLENNHVMFAFQVIEDTPGWTAVVGEPLDVHLARWRGPLANMLWVSVPTLLVALLLAGLVASRLTQPIKALEQRARRVAAGTADPQSGLAVKPSRVTELESLRQSLDAADAALQVRLNEAQAAKQSAEESLVRLQKAEDQAQLGSWTADLADRKLILSDKMSQMVGLDPASDQAINLDSLGDWLDPGDFERVRAGQAEVILGGQPFEIVVHLRRKDGSGFTAWMRIDLASDANGRPAGLLGTVQDITERVEQEARLAAVADNLPRGLIISFERDADRQLSVTYVSTGITALTGRHPQDIIGRSNAWAQLVHADDLPELIRMMRSPDEPGSVIDSEFRLLSEGGDPVWVRTRAALRRLEADAWQWDGVVIDITRERDASERLKLALRDAEAAEKAKGEFLATMSHEIRTPMNSVIGMTRLALRREQDPVQRDYLKNINGSALVLLGIINDILDFSKIEANEVELEDGLFSLDAVLETVVSINRLQAEEKGLELVLHMAPDLPAGLRGDSLRLGQILTNLVGNAIKFTQKGEIVIDISTEGPASGGRQSLVFEVRDSGIGMSAQQMEGLFKPFSQVEAATARKFGGTGLGLAISSRLVALMEGRIWCESVLGSGSRFFFTVNLPTIQEEGDTRDRSALLGGRAAQRILIVDDSAAARAALVQMAEGFGLVTDQAADAAEAIALIRAMEASGKPYSIVVLDWRMPVMDGLELAELIRADHFLSHVPAILMVTAYGQELIGERVDAIGFEAVLKKPVTQSMLFDAIFDTLKGGPRELPPAEGADHSDLEPMRRILAGRRVLVVDDNALNRDVAADFLHLVGVETEMAINGRDAIDRMNEHAFDAVLMDVHMPVMDGLEAVREIRSRPEWKRLPVIALTAQARVEDIEITHAAGMSGHLVKPIDEDRLFLMLAEMIGREPAPTGAPGPAPSAQDTRSRLLKRFRGSSANLNTFVNGFMRDFGDMPQVLAQLRSTGSPAGIGDYAHRIRGVVGYLGANDLYAICGEVEQAAQAGKTEELELLFPTMVALAEACLAEMQALQRQPV